VTIVLGTTDGPTVEQRRQMLEQVQHEIRTPLTSLLGHLELLEEADVELPYRLEISLHAVSRAGERLRQLLAELDESVGAPGH
jgi:signal transduction histidine kinase